jgi:SAM-dependent methyltransferase
VELPDVGRLLAIDERAVQSLAERLRAAGLGPAFAAKLARVGERLDDALRAPMRTWHARRVTGAAGALGRLFLLHDPVAVAEAQEALGDLAPLVEAGLLEEGTAGVTSPVHLALVSDAFCFGDVPGLGGDAVMPVCGGTLELVRAALPAAPVGSALDLGCGAGPVAILLARAAARVVASDVSPRALAFARFNLALNGVTNVELREGDLYETVRSERFDRIAAHPPFVARPAGAPASTFVHGGVRGDELPLRVLAGAPEHLTATGRAIVLGDWPLVDGDPLDARVRAAVGADPTDVLVLQSPPKNLDEYCTLLAAVEHRTLGEPFARAAVAHRDHLDRLGLRGLALACVVVARASGAPGWTALVPVRHATDAPLAGDAVERILAAHALANAPASTLAEARLRFPAGSRRVEQPMPGGAPPSLVVQPAPGSPQGPAVFDARVAALLARIAEAACVGDAGDGALDAARDALRKGALAVT